MLDNVHMNMPPKTVIGLRTPHIAEVRTRRPALDFLEIHAENYLDFGPAFAALLDVRRDYPISAHGVGLSLGSADGIDENHIARLRDLVDRLDPMLVSEHLSWTTIDGTYLNDLLPLPYTEESLGIVAMNIARAQDRLGRRLLIENPSRYLRYNFSTIPEAEFLAVLVQRTGCAILCDVNNIHVCAHNVGENPLAYRAALPADAIGEIHLAGHAVQSIEGCAVLIDDHGSPVNDAVWRLYGHALAMFGAVPVLIERDRNIPSLDDLLAEARHARDSHALAT